MFARGAKRNDDLGVSVESVSDGSEGYPKNFAVGALRERRLLAALRLVGICLAAAILVVLVQLFLLVSLFPLKEARPFLVQIAREGSVAASINPIQESFDASDLLTEKLVREYVVNRHEILRSASVMQARWGDYLEVTTEPREYRRFLDNATAAVDEIRTQGAERRVEIVSVSVLRDDVFIVDFRSISYDNRDREVDNRILTATVTAEFRALENLSREQMLINPTGFTVIDYTLAEKSQ